MVSDFSLRKSVAFQAALGLFVFFLLWRFYLYFAPATPDGAFNVWSFAWGATYQIVALYGAIIGLLVSRHWGGWHSRLGRATIVLALGLLFQSIGQAISSYYVFSTGDIPFPSWGDIGFFGSVLFYIWGVFLLAKLSGVLFNVKTIVNKLQVVLIPVIALVVSYFIFVHGREMDVTQPLTVFLDFGYPLGQALYVSVALLTYVIARDILGGVMRRPILLFLIALAVQYISDFTFLYQASRNLYIPEGTNDLMYFVSYFIMAVALIDLGQAFRRIKAG